MMPTGIDEEGTSVDIKRPCGKETLRRNIKTMRHRLDQYEALLNALPDTLSADANAGLLLMAYHVRERP